ncbi:MAG: hypothetical protein ACOY46_20675 [Bacillota bacterium]
MKEIVASDHSGFITRHYEDCHVCGGVRTLKVYECIFSSWSQVEKSCSACLFLERKIYGKWPPGRGILN